MEKINRSVPVVLADIEIAAGWQFACADEALFSVRFHFHLFIYIAAAFYNSSRQRLATENTELTPLTNATHTLLSVAPLSTTVAIPV